MGQTLTNGIYLPNEGERNCYSGLAANWNAVDTLKGNYSLHAINVDIHVTAAEKETWNGKADASALTAHTGDTTIHVTAEDKAAWNGKADASALTAHTGDTTIHVTASDKQTWNGKQDALSQTQLDAVNSGIDSTKVQQIATNTSDISSLQSGKANDSDVVHKSGNETITGTKTFEDVNIQLKSTYAEYSVSGGYKSVSFNDKNLLELSRTRLGIYSSGLSYIKQTILGYDSNNQQVDTTITFSWSSLTKPFIRPDSDNLVSLGTSGNKWKDVNTYLVNGLTPSSLGMPSDRSARIDISSYFTDTGTGQSNSYTVPANGYIYLTLSELTNVHCFSRTSGNVINYAQTFTKPNNSTGALYVLFPVRKNDVFVATWYTTTTVSVDGAFFIPCQGNI